jgi:hypothetical protein
MKKIKSNNLGIDQGSSVLFSDFQHDGEMWSGAGPREYRQRIDFGERYADPPLVQVGLSMWDLDSDTNPRMDISAEKIGAGGFEIVFRTWADTRIARVRADWIAFGALKDDDEWELY